MDVQIWLKNPIFHEIEEVIDFLIFGWMIFKHSFMIRFDASRVEIKKAVGY